MNKWELIKKYEEKYETIFGFPVIQLNQILEDLKQLDEPQKVTVPQFVARKIEYFKKTGDWDLFQAMDYSFGEKDIREWLEHKSNQETFARAWIDGYTVEVEKEKKYRVKLKGIAERYCYLNYSFLSEGWFFDDEHTNTNTRAKHTRKELEEAGFGEVFNSPLFEVEEVEDE